MRTLAPIRVRKGHYWGEWTVVCRRCGTGSEVTCGDDWGLAMETALGHLSFRHPQWPQVDTNGGVKNV